MPPINLWLDDLRNPADYGKHNWTWVKTVDEAIAVMRTSQVEQMSLDHDLGPRIETDEAGTVWELPERTGYDFVLWMVTEQCWPTHPPQVHSANPVGAARMRGTIQRYFPG